MRMHLGYQIPKTFKDGVSSPWVAVVECLEVVANVFRLITGPLSSLEQRRGQFDASRLCFLYGLTVELSPFQNQLNKLFLTALYTY